MAKLFHVRPKPSQYNDVYVPVVARDEDEARKLGVFAVQQFMERLTPDDLEVGIETLGPSDGWKPGDPVCHAGQGVVTMREALALNLEEITAGRFDAGLGELTERDGEFHEEEEAPDFINEDDYSRPVDDGDIRQWDDGDLVGAPQQDDVFALFGLALWRMPVLDRNFDVVFVPVPEGPLYVDRALRTAYLAFTEPGAPMETDMPIVRRRFETREINEHLTGSWTLVELRTTCAVCTGAVTMIVGPGLVLFYYDGTASMTPSTDPVLDHETVERIHNASPDTFIEARIAAYLLWQLGPERVDVPGGRGYVLNCGEDEDE